MKTMTLITLFLVLQAGILIFLLIDRKRTKKVIKTEKLEIGDFEITTEDNELSIKPKK